MTLCCLPAHKENWPCLPRSCSLGICWCLQMAVYSSVKQVLPAAINKAYVETKIANVQPEILLFWTACCLPTPAHQMQCCSARAAVSSAICFRKIWSSPVSNMRDQTMLHAMLTASDTTAAWLVALNQAKHACRDT